jgi:hypothetical protein
MKTALFIFLVCVVCASAQDKSPTFAPKVAPQNFVSHKTGLAMKFPSGLSYCPLPKDWSGEEEGTVVFLEAPSGCMPPVDSTTTRPTSGFVPSITVRYHANGSRDDAFDGKLPPSETSEAFARQFCAAAEVSQDFKLFERPAVLCRSEMHSNRVKIMLMAVFNSSRNNLMISLLTTHDRLAHDSQTLAAISSSITACQAASSKGKKDEKACPDEVVW